jgi:hypothetical protein
MRVDMEVLVGEEHILEVEEEEKVEVDQTLLAHMMGEEMEVRGQLGEEVPHLVKVEPLQEVEVDIEWVTITLLLRVVVETQQRVVEVREKTVMPILAVAAAQVLVT